MLGRWRAFGHGRRFVWLAMLGTMLVTLGLLVPTPSAFAATIPVTTLNDEYDVVPNATCSLREAIDAADLDVAFGGCPAGAGDDVITMPNGTYRFLLAGAGEDINQTGDLDVFSTIEIRPAGSGPVIIDAVRLDRVFHLPDPASNLTLTNVTVTGGGTPGLVTGPASRSRTRLPGSPSRTA